MNPTTQLDLGTPASALIAMGQVGPDIAVEYQPIMFERRLVDAGQQGLEIDEIGQRPALARSMGSIHARIRTSRAAEARVNRTLA